MERLSRVLDNYQQSFRKGATKLTAGGIEPPARGLISLWPKTTSKEPKEGLPPF